MSTGWSDGAENQAGTDPLDLMPIMASWIVLALLLAGIGCAGIRKLA